MLNRQKTAKDIRSRIKHENANLGAGTEMGGQPAGQGLHSNAFTNHTPFRQYASSGHHPSASTVSTHSLGAPVPMRIAHNANNASQDFYHQAHPLGAGPSFVSLSPSDSISNFEGRPGGTMTGAAGQLFEPSAGSTASFAQGLNDPNTPLRPARSVRRPQQAPPPAGRSVYQPSMRSPTEERDSSPLGRDLLSRKAGPSNEVISEGGTRPVNRHARSARLMAQVINEQDGRATPNSIQSEDDSAFDHYEEGEGKAEPPGKSYDSQMTISPPLGSLTRSEEPAALGSVLSALTQAGRKKGQARMLRGTTAEEESKRRKSERKVEMARKKESRPLEFYIDRNDEKAFREICAVLRKVQEEWGFVVEDDFNSVALALSLLDDSSLGSSKREFVEVKELIESALQGTVDDHYESFATAISLHNNVLSSLGSAQNGVSAARRRLRDAREALGAKRADLVQLWQRSQVVKESLRLLDTIENLKSVPDRLELLMSEKRFLEAVNLLMRSLKVIEKAEIAEVGASADLRGYLKGQEQAMFDILIEELHNHLYLKSFFCDTRWKSYSPGQKAIPNVQFGRDYEDAKVQFNSHTHAEEEANEPNRREKPNGENLKLFQYLKSLSIRPSFDPDLATDMPNLGMPNAFANGDSNRDMNASIMIKSQSTDSNLISNGIEGADQYQDTSPESDSFLYIEMLLESLARLGKLKLTQDIIHQRLTVELHQLVDSTIDEVDSRNELVRRSSVMVMRPESLLLSNSSALARSFAENTRNSFRNSSLGRSGTSFGSILGSASMRLSTLETSQMERDNETLRDLFWTLFSKLDAVLQGHRVVFEVITKISSRGASSAYKAVKIGKPSSLIEIWKPIEAEVRTLLYEHLVDDAESTSARRNVLISVNEVLRQGNFHRDHSKPLFKLVADSAPKPGVNLSRKDFAPLRRHEEALTSALRASVPGLVGSLDSVSIASFQQQSSIRSAEASFANTGGHKLLVKPDAFNISVLFQPALAFIERVNMLLPVEASGESDNDSSSKNGKGFSRFLDEFVKDVFLNQLEDKVHGLLMTAVGGTDAFQEDVTLKRTTSSRPIVRSASNVIVLIDSLYSMLRTTPFHRKSYSHLIIQTIVQYYQHCHEKFRDLVTSDMTTTSASTMGHDRAMASLPSFVISATWAQAPMISTCLVEAINHKCEYSRRKHLFDLENKLEVDMAAKSSPAAAATSNKSKGTVALSDLTTSRKKLSALCTLQNSMVWFHEHVQKLKATEDDVATSVAPLARLSLIGQVKPALIVGEGQEEIVEDEFKLPMNQDMATRFEALPKTFQHFSHIILFTLRVEIRARTIHYLDLAINEGNYLIEDVVLEPDPQIVDLNAELASLDDIFADTLLPQYHSFLFAGLASFMDLQLCQAIRKIRFINRHGLTKMIRNILALQQNLRNIVVIHETSYNAGNSKTNGTENKPVWLQASNDGFEKSTRLWELVGKEPEQMLSWIRSEGPMHSFDDYRSALNLMLGLENGLAAQTNSPGKTQATSSGGPSLPGANLKPGTTLKIAGDVSRQKLNEYLIELHEVAGEAL